MFLFLLLCDDFMSSKECFQISLLKEEALTLVRSSLQKKIHNNGRIYIADHICRFPHSRISGISLPDRAVDQSKLPDKAPPNHEQTCTSPNMGNIYFQNNFCRFQFCILICWLQIFWGCFYDTFFQGKGSRHQLIASCLFCGTWAVFPALL